MKKINKRSMLTFLLAISLIVTSAIGIPMLNGYAEGISGSYNPTLSCNITNLNGNSLMAYANSYTMDDTYPRLVTNGNQIRVRLWAFDTEGASSINLKLIKVQENNQLVSWLQPGYPDLQYDNNFSVQNNQVIDHVFTITAPGTYAVLATTTVNGRTTQNYKFFLYGPGTVVGGDFNYRLARPEGQALFCTLYDLGGTGIHMPTVTSLFVTKPGLLPVQSNIGLTITQDPSFPRRYKVFGYANRSQLQNNPGQYQSYLDVLPINSSTYSTIYFPPYN